LEGAAVIAGGAFLGYRLLRWKEKNLRAIQAEKAKAAVENARREADAVVREARLSAHEEAMRLRQETDRFCLESRQSILEKEQKLNARESILNSQATFLADQDKKLLEREQALSEGKLLVERKSKELDHLLAATRGELETIGRLSESEARERLIKEIETAALKDAADLTRHILDDAKNRAEENARRILSLAIQRYAGTHTFETTTATLALTGDEMKGRIIGRDGRNIRAFEAATGITVLIDDTPNAVVLSGFDPVRREIARESMQRLMLDGRIHPTRIEEVVQKVTSEMDENIIKAGQDALYTLSLPPMDPDVLRKLGALKFRYSFSQNILNHSIEVAQLMALMAAEMGLDLVQAKKSGLLHDIGKALDHEMEGSHAIIGADFIKAHGENDEVVNAVASHHDEVPHTTVLGILVSAADAISASRPGARSETMTTYIKRLENLERIGMSFQGVEKSFAIQAGRELRVFGVPEEIDDVAANTLARNVARRIEEELQYPGQIRVTVVRETRCTEYAK
ncbi:MAG: ribonuclease Y, partial [Verrucomicrobiales bacterium]